LREFVDILDLVDQNENYDPRANYQFKEEHLNPEEEHKIKRGQNQPGPNEVVF
jgi:hypothetical protein